MTLPSTLPYCGGTWVELTPPRETRSCTVMERNCAGTRTSRTPPGSATTCLLTVWYWAGTAVRRTSAGWLITRREKLFFTPGSSTRHQISQVGPQRSPPVAPYCVVDR